MTAPGRISNWIVQRGKTSGARSAIDVGWLIDAEEAGLIYSAPERLDAGLAENLHPKSAARCPAVIDLEARQFVVPCPYDITLRLSTQADGSVAVSDADGDRSAVRAGVFPRILTIVKAAEWRHPSRPIIQMAAPYRFTSDEPVYMPQLPPFLSYGASARPGIMLAGRMPVHIWPRILSFAFEWHDASKPLVLRRGEPWFYVQFEGEDPSRRVRLVEAEMTVPLQTYIRGMTGVVGYVRRTAPLFRVAASRRPERLLTPRVLSRAVQS